METNDAQTKRPQARLIPGFQDLSPAACLALQKLIADVSAVYASHGFDPLSTPSLEYAEAIGQFLPDEEEVNQGVFFLQEQGEPTCLRYDLTAPLARYVAMYSQHLPKPFKRYQIGTVWRNEKPGLGRFREFVQADADIVDTSSLMADAQLCMLVGQALSAAGFPDYVVHVSNRNILDGLLEKIGLRGLDPAYEEKKLRILRSIDKFDKIGAKGVEQLLGRGRLDASGDFTPGAMLPNEAISFILEHLFNAELSLDHLGSAIDNEKAAQGVSELQEVVALCHAGMSKENVRANLSIVRGLSYYTGTVFEAVLRGAEKLGAVASGGRYDSLVERFLAKKIPAVGCSVGISRLLELSQGQDLPPYECLKNKETVFILVLDDLGRIEAVKLAHRLATLGVACDVYSGSGGMQSQLKYANKRGFPLALIRGEDERSDNTVVIKELSRKDVQVFQKPQDRQSWLEQNKQLQTTVPFDEVEAKILLLMEKFVQDSR